MRSTGFLRRLALVACLGLTVVSASGCADENDPKTWVDRLPTANKRPSAMRRLRQMWESKLASTTPPNNLQDPQVQQMRNTIVGPVAQAFIEHREEIATRKEAIEILATVDDARAIPALLAALEFSPGNSESERIALRAAQALRDLHPQNNADVNRRLIATIDRATGNSGSAPAIREAVIQAIAAVGARDAVPVLQRVLRKPIDQQEIRTARAAADALGELGDTSADSVNALVYGLFLNVRRANAFNNCSRALVKLGPDAAVPALIATIQNQNPDVTVLINSYAGLPGVQPPPPGYQQATAIDVLRNFADPRGIEPLLTLLRDHEQTPNVRGASSEALGYTGLALPAADPRRATIFDALATVFREGTPGGEDDMAPSVAPALVLLGDPRAVGVIEQRLQSRQLQGADTVAYRLGLLMPLASAVRHDSWSTFDRFATAASAQLTQLVAQNPDAQSEIAPVQTQLATIRAVAQVAHDCNDGDLACYQSKLSDAEKNVVRKAAYMIAWTGGENPAARQALLQHADHVDPLVRRSINIAIDSLSPHGCAECITRLEGVITAERGQESKSLMHLEAQMLIARLRSRR